jgi:hypothetical protein
MWWIERALDFIFRVGAWFSGRPTLKVRIIEDEPDRAIGGLVFGVENVSPQVTSLSPTIGSTYWYPKRAFMRKGRTRYAVRETDLVLSALYGSFAPRK